jgi:pimeloyl-ACP methyl ester carboxylesterase
MPYLHDATWGRLYYEDEGDGPPVLLVHGAAQDTVSWRFQVPALAEAGYRALALDLPGHGKSALGPDGAIADLAVYAEVVRAFLAALDLSDVVVVGHSMAGGIGLHAALREPARFAGVVPVDGAGFTNRTYNDDFFDLVRHNPQDWFEVNFRTICSPSTPAARVDEIAFDVSRCAPEVAWSDIAAYARLDLSEALGDLSVPVTFLHGADDWSITPEMAEQTLALCTGTRTAIEVLEGTGHFPHTEAPDRFNPALLRALSDLVGR